MSILMDSQSAHQAGYALSVHPGVWDFIFARGRHKSSDLPISKHPVNYLNSSMGSREITFECLDCHDPDVLVYRGSHGDNQRGGDLPAAVTKKTQ